MSQTTELYLITAGGKIRCLRCKARSSRTKLQCAKPALKGKVVCGHHGGYSTGPRTKEGKERIRSVHLKHGQETQEARAERSKKSEMFRYLTDLGNYYDLFYKPLKTRGRPPSSYTQLDLKDPEQLALAIMRMLSSK
jgi:hypothetical protein